MAYRYTNTDKWNDAWFVSLKPDEKLVFNFLCDNCDIAGFIELIPGNWVNPIGMNKSRIEGALKGLQRGLIYSKLKDCIYIRTFLKHQKNLPLNPEKNMAHRGIIKRFEMYSFKFQIENINEFIEGASKGLNSPYGIGNGNGIGNGKEREPRKIFKKPTIKEIQNYCEERKNSIDAQKFFDFYESKGWMIGKNKMKDWKASVRTWENTETKSEKINDIWDK